MAWTVSPILVPLIADVKREFPGIEVGTIGDAAHKAEETGSDHNPDQWNFVCAADFMFGNGFGATQAEALFDRLNQLRDSRTAYVIYNRRIESSTVSPWTVRSYTGSDPHTAHVHVSVKHSSNPRPTTSWNVYPSNVEDDVDENSIAAKIAADANASPASGNLPWGVRRSVFGYPTGQSADNSSFLADFGALFTMVKNLGPAVANVDEEVIAKLGNPSTPDAEVAAALSELLGDRKAAVLALMQ